MIACIAGGALLLAGAGFFLYRRRRAAALRKLAASGRGRRRAAARGWRRRAAALRKQELNTPPAIQSTSVFLAPQRLPVCAAVPTSQVVVGIMEHPQKLTAVRGASDASLFVPSAPSAEALEEGEGAHNRECVVCIERPAVMVQSTYPDTGYRNVYLPSTQTPLAGSRFHPARKYAGRVDTITHTYPPHILNRTGPDVYVLV